MKTRNHITRYKYGARDPEAVQAYNDYMRFYMRMRRHPKKSTSPKPAKENQMKYRMFGVAAALAAALTTTTASAQLLGSNNQAPIGVYDANNKFVGRLLYPGVALIQYGPNRIFAVGFDRDGLDADGPLFLYTSSNCTGPKLLVSTQGVPKWAHFEKATSTFWVQSNYDKTIVEARSQSYEGDCSTFMTNRQITLSPALAIDTKVNFNGPFSVR